MRVRAFYDARNVSIVAVTGVAGYLGRRVLDLLEADDGVQRVIGIDSEEPIAGSPKLEFHLLDVRDARVGKIFVGVDCVVHLAFQHDPIREQHILNGAPLAQELRVGDDIEVGENLPISDFGFRISDWGGVLRFFRSLKLRI